MLPGGETNCSCPGGQARGRCYDLAGDPAAASRLVGGEAAVWAEHVAAAKLGLRAWPRGCVVAEWLWSAQAVNTVA